jgi:hypothetical protein
MRRCVALLRVGVGLLVGVAIVLGALGPVTALRAQYRGGGAHSSVRGANVNHSANVNRNTNVNRNANVNQNVNVNRNVNVNVHESHGPHYDRWGHPVAAVAAVTASAVAVGTVVASLPMQCSVLVVHGATYQKCGDAYYQPVYHGSAVQYVVVVSP